MSADPYKRGWEDCLDTLYYRLVSKGITDPRVYDTIKELQTAIKEDKIHRIMRELGLI